MSVNRYDVDNDLINFLRPSVSPFSFSNKGLSQDFFVDTFYLGDDADLGSGDVAKKIDFSGNHIQVLNNFIPGSFETIFPFYHYERNQRFDVLNNNNIIIPPKVIPILGKMNWELEYEFLYRTNDIATLFFTQVAEWFWSYNKFRSTPILTMLSKTAKYHYQPIFKNENFIYSVGSLISTTANTLVNNPTIIRNFHGWTDVVQVHIEIDALVNPLDINFKQISPDGVEWSDVSFTIIGAPYSNLITLPQRFCSILDIELGGGGAGETGGITMNIILSPRS